MSQRDLSFITGSSGIATLIGAPAPCVGKIPSPARALNGQILVDAKVHAEIKALAELEAVGQLALKGFHRPVEAFNVRNLRPYRATVGSPHPPQPSSVPACH